MSLFFNNNGVSNTFSSLNSTQTQNQQSIKKFLSGRPSLQDILSIAPEWEAGFRAVHSRIVEQDKQVEILRTKLNELRKSTEECRKELAEKQSIADVLTQNHDLLSDKIDEQQPLIRKLNRQATSLSSSCQRLVPSSGGVHGKFGSAIIVVPQPENMRFIEDLKRRTTELQIRADTILKLVDSMKKSSTDDTTTNLESNIKNTLWLLLNVYKQLKLRHVGLDDDLKSLSQSYSHILNRDKPRSLES